MAGIVAMVDGAAMNSVWKDTLPEPTGGNKPHSREFLNNL